MGDLYIGFLASYVQGSTRSPATDGDIVTTATTLRLVDDDRAAPTTATPSATEALRLTFFADKASISNEAEEQTITVTAYLNGKNPYGEAKSFNFRDVEIVGSDGTFDTFLMGELGEKFDQVTDGTENPFLTLLRPRPMRVSWQGAMWIMMRAALARGL